MINSFSAIFIFVCWVVVFGYIFIQAFNNKKNANSDRMWRRITILAILLSALRLTSPLRAYHLNEIGFPSLSVVVLADVVTFLGTIVVLWARTILGRNWSAIPSIKEKHELIKSGPYKYVRHPMYTGFLLLFLGLMVWANSSVVYILIIPVIFGFWYKAQREEKLLSEHFSEEYPAYKKRTKMLIPFIW